MKPILLIAMLGFVVPARADEETTMIEAPTTLVEVLPDAPVPVRPSPKEQYKFSTRNFALGVSLLATAQTADAVTTRRVLNEGGWELNPIFGKHPSVAKQSLINLGSFAAESIAFYFTEHNSNRWVRWMGRTLIGGYVVTHAQLAACNAGID